LTLAWSMSKKNYTLSHPGKKVMEIFVSKFYTKTFLVAITQKLLTL